MLLCWVFLIKDGCASYKNTYHIHIILYSFIHVATYNKS